MPERTLKQEVLNQVDVSKLLRRFTSRELALVFNCTQDYVNKTERLQKIIVGEITAEDEMKLGRKGAWKNSIERKIIKQIENNNNQSS